MKNVLAALALLGIGSCLTGCSNQDGSFNREKADKTLETLERGKARGHLSIHASPKLGAGTRNDFYFGTLDTDISFDGDINFAGNDYEPVDGGVSTQSEGN